LAENEAKMKTSHCLGDRDAMMRSAAMSLYRTDADTGLETAQKKQNVVNARHLRSARTRA
jgi:hypothetical protein